jgi:short-subunit dehydrogenase
MKTILITGSSSGIGKATALFFLQKQWFVIGLNKGSSHIQHKNYEEYQVDITDYAKVEEVLEKILSQRKVDCLFNNAGYGYFSPVELASMEEVKKVFETNFFAQIFMTQKFVKYFREKGGGTIVTTSSLSGRISTPYFTFYSSTKWALEGFLENLRYELVGTNIKLRVIEPTVIKTNFFSSEKIEEVSASSFYYRDFIKSVKGLRARGNKGIPQEVVAMKVWRAVNSKGNRFRYLVGLQAELANLLRHIMPLNLYQYIIREFLR